MHEVSICQSIINTIEAEFEEEQLINILEVHLKIGVLSCVQTLILEHMFKLMIADSPFKNAVLKTDMVEILAECEYCNKNFNVTNYRFICPECLNPVSKIIEGKELKIYKIILEEPAYEKVDQ
ncbi:MAG: hydrogenase maturation nickel metallochaperone HypA [Bacteroidota bacterium]|nr:hydrogenase maturation nickel metallochaperone HypA [Bacteroidota bacterium]